MSKQCICDNEIKKLQNKHYQGRTRVLSIDKDKKLIVISDNNDVVAEFQANYCPICGKPLERVDYNEKRKF